MISSREEGFFEEAQLKQSRRSSLAARRGHEEEEDSKVRMAALLKTSRTQVDRLLDPKNDITLSSLQRAAAMVGRRVMIRLI